MKKTFTLFLSLLVGLTMLLTANTAFASSVADLFSRTSLLGSHSPSKKKLSEDDIVAQYNTIRAKRKDGFYGKSDSKGTQIIKGHEVNIANYLSLKMGAEQCRDIQKRIPSLESGYYVFSSTADDINTSYVQTQLNLLNSIINEKIGVDDIREIIFRSKGPQPIIRYCPSVASVIAAMSPIL